MSYAQILDMGDSAGVLEETYQWVQGSVIVQHTSTNYKDIIKKKDNREIFWMSSPKGCGA